MRRGLHCVDRSMHLRRPLNAIKSTLRAPLNCVDPSMHRPTQSVMYVPSQVNRVAEIVLLIVQYRYLKSCSADFYAPESSAQDHA